jgi:hypothetical protein
MSILDTNRFKRLPHELKLKIAESDMSAALIMALKRTIDKKEFRDIVNEVGCRQFEEYWSFLRKIRKLHNEEVWRELASELGWSQITGAWRVLNIKSCWKHQHWANLSKYKLAIRGMLSCPMDKDLVAMQGCRRNPATLSYNDVICEEHDCYLRSMAYEDSTFGQFYILL